MSERVRQFLQDIERDATRKGLSKLEVGDMIAEVSAHLDASIQARLELGMTISEAESESVLNFGNPKAFVRTKTPPSSSEIQLWFDRRVGVSLAIVLLVSAACSPFVHVTDHPFLAWCYPFVLAGLVCIPSLRAKRPQIFPLVGAFLIGIPLFTAAYSIQDSYFISNPSSATDPWASHFYIGRYVSGSVICFVGVFSLLSWAVARILEVRKRLRLA